MNDDLETLLRKNLLQPPPDFAQRVMTNLAVKNLAVQIAAASLSEWTEARPETRAEVRTKARPTARPTTQPATRPQAGQLLRWLAARAAVLGVGLGAGAGLTQLASFVFGLWLSATAL